MRKKGGRVQRVAPKVRGESGSTRTRATSTLVVRQTRAMDDRDPRGIEKHQRRSKTELTSVNNTTG